VIGIDTNVLVRYLVRDEPEQTALADQLVDALEAEDPAFVSVVVLVETWWVLRRSYRFSRQECLDVLTGLAGSRQLVLESAEVVRQALTGTAAGADFADALIAALGRRAGCAETVTFDQGSARRAGMRLLV
jgi:predicted nucleic-acid-binding protein